MGEVVFEGVRAIANFGILAGIGMLFIVIFYIQFKNYWKLMIKFQEEKDAQNKMLLEHFIDEFKTQNEKTSKNAIKKETEEEATEYSKNLLLRMLISQKITNCLYELRHVIDASRIYVVEFHNSNHNLTGLPFAKFSCTYENCRYGAEIPSKIFTNFPFSSLASIVHETLLSGQTYIIYENVNLLKDSSYSLYSIIHKDAKQIAFFGLYDTQKALLGYVVIEFAEEGQVEQININNVLNSMDVIQSMIDLKNPNF